MKTNVTNIHESKLACTNRSITNRMWVNVHMNTARNKQHGLRDERTSGQLRRAHNSLQHTLLHLLPTTAFAWPGAVVTVVTTDAALLKDPFTHVTICYCCGWAFGAVLSYNTAHNTINFTNWCSKMLRNPQGHRWAQQCNASSLANHCICMAWQSRNQCHN